MRIEHVRAVKVLEYNMKEVERNKRLILLIQKLQSEKDIKNLELLKTLINNDTEAMKKTFEIINNNEI